MVARDRIELSTRGFSVLINMFLMIHNIFYIAIKSLLIKDIIDLINFILYDDF